MVGISGIELSRNTAGGTAPPIAFSALLVPSRERMKSDSARMLQENVVRGSQGVYSGYSPSKTPAPLFRLAL
jgi:hypothetical protein